MKRTARKKILLGSAVAAVQDSRQVSRGTAFLVAERLAITCGHVLTAAGARGLGDNVILRFTQAPERPEVMARIIKWSNEEDAAVLELWDGRLPVAGAVVAPLSAEPYIDRHPFVSYGYPAAFPQALQTRGLIQGEQNSSRFQIVNTAEPGVPLQEGYSGAPVWDEASGAVVGMIRDTVYGGVGHNGLAISAATLLSTFDELRPAVQSPKAHLKERAQTLLPMLIAEVTSRTASPTIRPDRNDGVEYLKEGGRGTAYFALWSQRHALNAAHPDDGDLFFVVSLTAGPEEIDRDEVEVAIALELSERGARTEAPFSAQSVSQLVRKAALFLAASPVNDVIADEGEWSGLQFRIVRLTTLRDLPSVARTLAGDWQRISEVFDAFQRSF